MKAFSFYFLLTLVAIAIQGTLFKSVKPDFIFILVCFYALRYGRIKGLIYGAITGLLVDIASGFIFGTNIISKAVISYLIVSVRGKVFHWNIIVNTIALILFSILDIFLVYMFLKTVADVSLVNMSLKTGVVQIIYTTIFSIMLYPVLTSEKEDNIFQRRTHSLYP